MPYHTSFDRFGVRFIRLSLWFSLCCASPITGCQDRQPAGADAGSGQASTPGGADAAQPTAEVEASDRDEPPPTEKPRIVGQGEQAIARAVGRARKGVDIGLARQLAAARARGDLLNLLKEKGYLSPEQHELSGISIERIWIKGHHVFAVATIALKNLHRGLNQHGLLPSNQAEGDQPDAAAPPGGTRP